MPKSQPKLTTYGGETVPVGGTAQLDGNYPVTVAGIRPPCDDEDNGAVTIRFEWGATDSVAPVRLGGYITA